MEHRAGDRLAVPIDEPPDGRTAGDEADLDGALAGLDEGRAGEPPGLVDERDRAGPAGLEADRFERRLGERLDLAVGGQSISDDPVNRLAVGVDQPALA